MLKTTTSSSKESTERRLRSRSVDSTASENDGGPTKNGITSGGGRWSPAEAGPRAVPVEQGSADGGHQGRRNLVHQGDIGHRQKW
jgi:hypothetical protein